MYKILRESDLLDSISKLEALNFAKTFIYQRDADFSTVFKGFVLLKIL